MLQKLAFWNWFRGAGATTDIVSASEALTPKKPFEFDDIYGREVEDAELIMYPPKHVGIPVFSLNAIKKRYAKQMQAVIEHSGMGDHRVTDAGGLYRDALYSKVMDNFIAYAHMVPASEGYHHDKPGGLLVHCLEVATMAIRISKQERPFVGDDFIDVQRIKEQRMPYAAFLGGLLHDSGKLFTDVRVSALFVLPETGDQNGGDIDVVRHGIAVPDWRPERESLLSWAKRFAVTRYTVTYLPTRVHRRHNSQSAQLASKIITPEGLDYLLTDQLNLHEPLIDALTGYSDSKEYLASVIRRADSKSAAEDAIRIHSAFTGMQNLSAFQKIHKLIKISYPNWSFNKQSGHAWCIGGSVFLSWTRAFDAIIDTSRKTQIFIPRSAEFLYELMLENSIVKEFGGRDRTIKFHPGKFKQVDIEKIHSGENPATWHHLIEVRDWNTLFDGDALPKSAPGVIHSPKTGDYLVTDTQGEVTIYKSDELEASIAQQAVAREQAKIEQQAEAEANEQAIEDAKDSIAKAKESERLSRANARAKASQETASATTSSANATPKQITSPDAGSPVKAPQSKRGVPKAKSRISPAMIAQMAGESTSDANTDESTPANDSNDSNVTEISTQPPNDKTTSASISPDTTAEEVTPPSLAHLLPQGMALSDSKHKGFKVIDAGALGKALDMTAAEAIEDLIQKGVPFSDVPGEVDQLIEVSQSKQGVKFLAYISVNDAGVIMPATTENATSEHTQDESSKPQATLTERRRKESNSGTNTPERDSVKAVPEESKSATTEPSAKTSTPNKRTKSSTRKAQGQSTSKAAPASNSSSGQQSAEPTMELPGDVEQAPAPKQTLETLSELRTEDTDSKKKKGKEEATKALPVNDSVATTILHHCQAAPRGSLAHYIAKLHEKDPSYAFVYESDISAVGFDRSFTRALVSTGLASSLSAVGSIPYIIFEHFPDEDAESRIYWYKTPVIYLHLSHLSEVQLGELK